MGMAGFVAGVFFFRATGPQPGLGGGGARTCASFEQLVAPTRLSLSPANANSK
jgi:hypothetical protein